MRGIIELLCLLIWGFLTWGNPCSASEPQPPNVLIILLDDLGYSDLGCYGGEIRTPHIDRLAERGLRFTQFYTSARCCPTRASLMTGLYPSLAGIGDFTRNKPHPKRGPGYIGRLNEQCVTLAEALKPSGYQCYYVGKWHMHPQTGPIQRGFDEFFGYTRGHSHDQYDAEYYIRLPKDREKEIEVDPNEFFATDVFNDYALHFLKQTQQKEEPWFLFLGHSSPHFPIQAPADRADPYETIYRRGWDELREERYQRMQDIGLVDGSHWQLTPRSLVPVDGEEIANGFPGEPNPAWDSLSPQRQADLTRRMSVFAAMVESVDRGVGKIIAHLNDSNELENTLILIMSDNGACYEWGPFGFDGPSRKGTTVLREGEQLRETGGPNTYQSYGSGWANLGNTPFRMYKHFTHEGGLSSPLIAHWPQGISTGDRWIRDPTHVMDIMPTILEVSNSKYPLAREGNKVHRLSGTSLFPLFEGHTLEPRGIGFDHQGAHALRRGNWKAVWSKRMPEEIRWELYNLANDRCEMHDLANSEPQILADMVKEWERWAHEVGVIWEPPQK